MQVVRDLKAKELAVLHFFLPPILAKRWPPHLGLRHGCGWLKISANKEKMTLESLALFLIAVALGSYVQTVTGFAIGLIVMGTASTLDLAPIPFCATVVCFLSFWNGLIALRRNHATVNWKITAIVLIGAMPTMIGGVCLLNYLSQFATSTIKLVLGIVVIAGGCLLVLKPNVRKGLEPSWSFLLSGVVAGGLGGLFSTGGPPLVYHLYRQPISINIIRTTLLAIFLILSFSRIVVVGFQGQIDAEVIKYCLLSIPVVTLFTLVGDRYPPPLSDMNRRRFAFFLLIIVGGSLALTGLNM